MTHPQLPLDAPACAARELSPEMGGASLVCSRKPGHHGCHFDARTDWHWMREEADAELLAEVLAKVAGA